MKSWLLPFWYFSLFGSSFRASHHIIGRSCRQAALLLALYFIRTRFQWYHTHSNSGAISPPSKQVLYKGLSLCLSSHQCLLMMHAAHVFNIDTLLSPSLIHTLQLCSLSPLLSSRSAVHGVCLAAGFCLFIVSRWQTQTSFVWLSSSQRAFYCLGSSAYPVSSSRDFMMGLFIRSNWKQLSLTVCVRESRRKKLSPLNIYTSS